MPAWVSEMRTFREAFPNSYFFAVKSPEEAGAQNMIFVGVNGDKEIDFGSKEITGNKNPIIASLAEKRIDANELALDNYLLLTDNHAPVEYLTSKTLKRTIGTE